MSDHEHEDDGIKRSLSIRVCSHGTIYIDCFHNGRQVDAFGLDVETAMAFSDQFMDAIGEAVEIQKADLPCAGSA